MLFSTTLIEAKLIKRYKRFLADVILKNGQIITVYCPNPGSLLGLTKENTKILLDKSKNNKSKYQYIWRIVENNEGVYICVDTQMANKIIYESLIKKQIPELINYDTIIPEPKIKNGSRLDFLLETKNEPSCFIEVKSSTLSRSTGISEFPDSVTSRGSKHLSLLADLKKKGFRAVQIYLIQRIDVDYFKIAQDIDEAYFNCFENAKNSGVEILALQSDISKQGIKLSKKRPLIV